MAAKKNTDIPQTESIPTTTPATKSPKSSQFPIVGIGASAGGLEAIEQFLKNVSEASGLALVVIQHLDPNHKGIMAELLQRVTKMKVTQARDRQPVEPDCIYVIPPNKDMSILHGVLHLLKPTAARGLRLPIDFFFRSLAEDRREAAIGVILSGMGSDGTMGVRAIKEKAGLVLVQDPASAKFDGMPRSVIEAGFADFVAPADQLPAKIIGFLKHVPLIAKPGLALENKAQGALEKAVILLRNQTGQDFSMYKKSTLYRRVERRMGIHQIDKISFYVRYLQENPQELEILFKELLIGVTNFFRDPAAWDQLKTQALQPLLVNWPAGKTLRAWTPGCSTGEEAYSLAMVYKETLEQTKPRTVPPIQIFATDLDREAIDKARQGIFPISIAADVSAERLKRFFVKEDNGYRIRKEIRELVTFAPQNVIMDPPFTKLDILTCRNLLIYLTTESQKKLIPLFHYSLNPGGILFLGSAETIGSSSQMFTAIDAKARLFRRLDTGAQTLPAELPTAFIPGRSGTSEEPGPLRPVVNLQSLADQLLLREYSPAAVLVNDNGDIVYISGRTGKYLEPAMGKANWNIFAMARDGLRHELPGAFKRALRQKEALTIPGLQVGTNGGVQVVDLAIQAITEPAALRGTVIIVFRDAPPAPEVKPAVRGKSVGNRDARVEELEKELSEAREDLRIIREEMQASQEELKSTNEELQSTNEELQSTNEELTTSKEEMQSMNEELQTINAEQQVKVEEFSRANNDMKNLLNSTDIATVFLDIDLNIRRFTTQATKLIKLIPSDIGRPVTDLSSSLLYPDLREDAQEVLRSLIFKEKRIHTSDNLWFKARIMPYRTSDNKIDGLVMTFVDITESNTLEAELRRLQAELQKRFADQTAKLAESDRMIGKEISGHKLDKSAGKSAETDEPDRVKP